MGGYEFDAIYNDRGKPMLNKITIGKTLYDISKLSVGERRRLMECLKFRFDLKKDEFFSPEEQNHAAKTLGVSMNLYVKSLEEKIKLAASEETDPKLLDVLFDKTHTDEVNESVRIALAGNRKISRKTFDKLFERGDNVLIYLALAGNDSCPADILTKIYKLHKNDKEFVLAFAGNASSPLEMLEDIEKRFGAADKEINKALRSNRNWKTIGKGK